MTHVRIIIGFGALLQLPGCRNAKEILSEMEFKAPKRREEIVTRAQAHAIIAEAHRQGYHSIAFAQALMTGLGMRQKDAIGEYVPRSQPGLSEVTDGPDKWIIGLRWSELDGMLLTHRLSKSIRGSKAVSDLDEGKVKRYDLSLYPLIVEELALIPLEKRTGPMVIAEHSGKPWRQKVFGDRWRKIARAAGVPDHVQNRDSRAGSATEADEAGADVELIRQSLGHARTDTTRIYMRGEDAATAKVAILRFKNDPKTP
jgi:integrase